MGRDTKYLTLAAIVLMAIASLIVITSTKKKNAPAVSDINTTTTLGDEETPPSTTTKKGDLYADAQTSSSPDPVRESYEVLSGDAKTIEKTAASKPEAVPSNYDEAVKPQKEKFIDKTPNPPKTKPTPAKVIAEDTGPVFVVQTSVLASTEAAEKAKQALVAKGYKSAGVFQSGKNYLVYAGKFQKKESANELKKRLDKAKITAFVKELK